MEKGNYFEINGLLDMPETNGEVEDDFPFCSLSGCEAVKEGCHIGCPYGKENYSV